MKTFEHFKTMPKDFCKKMFLDARFYAMLSNLNAVKSGKTVIYFKFGMLICEYSEADLEVVKTLCRRRATK